MVLISPTLMHAVKKIEHVNYGIRVSDHSAVVTTLDWAETDKGQGVFRCGAETHKNKKYQEIIYCSLYKSVLDYVEDTSVQNDLRAQVDKILALMLKRNKIANDVKLDPIMKEGTLFVMEDTIRNLTNLLPKLEGLIVIHITGKAMQTLVFLLQKASEVTRLFNKQKSGSRARERVKILDNLNTILQNPDSKFHETEEAEVRLTEFDEGDIWQILQKNENYRMFGDEQSSKRFLTLENSKSSYNNNVSHLEVEEEIIDDSTTPK